MQTDNRKSILIVEDEEGLCAVLSTALESHGFNTIVARDGEDGLKKILEKKPDLVILDLTLPKISGETICKEVKDNYNKSVANIPVIIVSAKDSDTDRVHGKVLGASAYFIKPFSIEILIQKIFQLLPELAFE
jgi:DNA-binding response OmpR family regulator